MADFRGILKAHQVVRICMRHTFPSVHASDLAVMGLVLTPMGHSVRPAVIDRYVRYIPLALPLSEAGGRPPPGPPSVFCFLFSPTHPQTFTPSAPPLPKTSISLRQAHSRL